MKSNIEKKIISLLKFSIVALSAYYLLIFIFIALSRISYPFELEMMEGGMLENAIRIIEGKAIYTAPGIEYIPFIYPPLYFHLSAFIISMFGESFFSLRLISLLSTSISLVLIFAFVKKETGNMIFAISSAGLFAGVFQITGFWFDLARVDSLFLMLILSTIFILRCCEGKLGLIISSILAILAFLTKQTTMIIIIPMFLYLIITHKFKSLFFILPFLSGIVITTLIFDYQTEGWYSFWIFELPSTHEWNFKYLLSFWSYDVFKHTSLMFLITVAWIIFSVKDQDRKKLIFYALFLTSIIMAVWLQRLHLGGFVNANIPFYAAISITFSLGVNYFYIKQNSSSNQSQVSLIIIFIVILSQLLALNYNPAKAIPKKDDLIAGNKLIRTIKKNDGQVFIPNHGYLCRKAGKSTYAHWVGFLDLMIGKSELKYKLEDELRNKLESGFFKIIIVNEDFSYHLIEKYYTKKEAIFDNDVFMTISQKARPQYIYIPKN